jgi:hypothetical protein
MKRRLEVHSQPHVAKETRAKPKKERATSKRVVEKKLKLVSSLLLVYSVYTLL